ncbi:hypothetical protein HNO89_002983 [Sporosarcina luteola]|nr:hypothetical protein [Sporosarcina luteola]
MARKMAGAAPKIHLRAVHATPASVSPVLAIFTLSELEGQ